MGWFTKYTHRGFHVVHQASPPLDNESDVPYGLRFVCDDQMLDNLFRRSGSSKRGVWPDGTQHSFSFTRQSSRVVGLSPYATIGKPGHKVRISTSTHTLLVKYKCCLSNATDVTQT